VESGARRACSGSVIENLKYNYGQDAVLRASAQAQLRLSSGSDQACPSLIHNAALVIHITLVDIYIMKLWQRH
jgi:hypothetical protein